MTWAAARVALACFDLDNTLVDRGAAFVSWARDFVGRHGLPAAALERLLVLDRDGFASREELFAPLRREFGVVASVGELIADYRIDYPRHIPPALDSVSALARLRRAGWRVAVVTNGPPSQREKLERAGLALSVDAVCVSDELGVAKPDPAIFAEAARRCGTSLEEAAGTGVMVGDSPTHDVAGGRAAGLRTIWIRRDRAWTEPAYAPDATVASVAEAVDLLLG